MVDFTLPLKVRPPPVSDLSTSMLDAYRLRQARAEEGLLPLKAEAARNRSALSSIQLQAARRRQGALADYQSKVAAGDPMASAALAGQPDLQASAYKTTQMKHAMDVQAFGDAAKAVYPLRGTPEFKDAFVNELDGLRRGGQLDERTYREMKDKVASDPAAADHVLRQVLAMSQSFEQYQKMRSHENASAVLNAAELLLRGGPQTAGGPAPIMDRYLITATGIESGGRNVPNASGPGGAPASSAFGPLQYTEDRWADLIKDHPELGMTAADRFDPRKQLAAEPAERKDNEKALPPDIAPTDRNLYMMHFLGRTGGPRFLTGLGENPNQPATNLVSKEAAARNRSVFYSPGGQPLTAGQVYKKLTDKFGDRTLSGYRSLAPRAEPQATFEERLAAAAPALVAGSLGVSGEDRKALLDVAKMGMEYSKPTTLARNLRAAGLRPGTPAYEQAMREAVMDGKETKVVNGRLYLIDKITGKSKLLVGGAGPAGFGLEAAGTAEPQSAGEGAPQTKAPIYEAYGPISAMASAAARASDIVQSKIPSGLQSTVAALTQAEQLRNDAINALTMNSSVPGRLKMVQDRVAELVPKAGTLTHGPAEAATKWMALKAWIDNEYQQRLTMLDPNNPGYDAKMQQTAAQEALALRSVSRKIAQFTGAAGVPSLAVGEQRTINGTVITRTK